MFKNCLRSRYIGKLLRARCCCCCYTRLMCRTVRTLQINQAIENDETNSIKPFVRLWWSSSSTSFFIVALPAIPFFYRDYMPQIKRKCFEEREKTEIAERTNTTDHSQYHFSLLNFNELPIIIQYSCKIISTLVYRNIKCASLFIPNIIYRCFRRATEKDEINWFHLSLWLV